MNENEKKKNNVGVIVLIIILVLALLGTSSYIILDKFILKSNVEDKSEKENVEEEQEQKEELSLTDSSFSRILDAVSDFTYTQNRENGYSSFSPNELLRVVAKDFTNNDFTYVGEQTISGINHKVYQLSYQTIINKLKQYFPSDISFEPTSITNSTSAASLPNVNFGEGSGMGILSYDGTTGTYQVYFGGIGGTTGPMPTINERKVTEAYRLGDSIYVKEKAIYYTSDIIDYTNYVYQIYSHPNQVGLLDTLTFTIDNITSQTISVDNYLDNAATISYVFTLDKETGNYVFSSSKID